MWVSLSIDTIQTMVNNKDASNISVVENEEKAIQMYGSNTDSVYSGYLEANPISAFATPFKVYLIGSMGNRN